MQLEALAFIILVGAIAGYLADIITKGYGFGTVGNIIVGIFGATFGGWLLPQFVIYQGSNFASQTLSATLGAIIVLALVGLIRKVA